MLLVFARVPVPGRVKTRLIATLGEEGACALHIRLVERVLARCAGAAYDQVQVWLDADAGDNPVCRRWRVDWPYAYHVQQGGDLGERMYHAFDRALRRFRSAVLIGCDCPELCLDDLLRARRMLAVPDRACAVLGGSEDGGYYLIGLNRSCPQAFDGIPWGEDGVAALTRRRLRQQGLRLGALPLRWDLDRPAELPRYAMLVDTE